MICDNLGEGALALAGVLTGVVVLFSLSKCIVDMESPDDIFLFIRGGDWTDDDEETDSSFISTFEPTLTLETTFFLPRLERGVNVLVGVGMLDSRTLTPLSTDCSRLEGEGGSKSEKISESSNSSAGDTTRGVLDALEAARR